MKSSGEKCEMFDVHSEPCSEEDLQHHLIALVDNLVSRHARARWRLILSKPKRWQDDIRGYIPFDERYCKELVGKENWPQHIENHTGSQKGVYWVPGEQPVKLRPREAASLATWNQQDVIYSILPGRMALFFNHESQVWLCKRP